MLALCSVLQTFTEVEVDSQGPKTPSNKRRTTAQRRLSQVLLGHIHVRYHHCVVYVKSSVHRDICSTTVTVRKTSYEYHQEWLLLQPLLHFVGALMWPDWHEIIILPQRKKSVRSQQVSVCCAYNIHCWSLLLFLCLMEMVHIIHENMEEEFKVFCNVESTCSFLLIQVLLIVFSAIATNLSRN